MSTISLPDFDHLYHRPLAAMVVASKVLGDDEEVTVAFEGRGVKRLMASYAKMEKD